MSKLTDEIDEFIETKGCGHYSCEEILVRAGEALKQRFSLEEAIEIIKAEPETISSSQSFRQGYVRCARDKVRLLEQHFEDKSNG